MPRFARVTWASLILSLAGCLGGCLDLAALESGSGSGRGDAPDGPARADIGTFGDGGGCAGRCTEEACRDTLACVAGLVSYGLLSQPGCAAGDQGQGEPFFKGMTGLPTCSQCRCTLTCGAQITYHDADNMCTAFKSMVSYSANTCITPPGSTQFLKLETPQTSCGYSGPPVQPDVAFDAHGRLCVPASHRPCETLSCVQQLPGRACVAIDGRAMACPAPFVDAGTWYRDYSDPRSCACCGEISPAGCARLDLSSMDNCKNVTGAAVAGACTKTMGVKSAALTILPEACLSRPVGDGAPTSSKPITLCCTP